MVKDGGVTLKHRRERGKRGVFNLLEEWGGKMIGQIRIILKNDRPLSPPVFKTFSLLLKAAKIIYKFIGHVIGTGYK